MDRLAPSVGQRIRGSYNSGSSLPSDILPLLNFETEGCCFIQPSVSVFADSIIKRSQQCILGRPSLLSTAGLSHSKSPAIHFNDITKMRKRNAALVI
jgi:hypothetical protein